MKRTIKITILISVIFLSILLLWYFGPRLIYWYLMSDIPFENNELFEAINSLFSGLAFGGLICTLIIQRRDISDNSKQIRESQEIAALSSLLSIYFEQEKEYRGKDFEKSEKARKKKEEILSKIETRFN